MPRTGRHVRRIPYDSRRTLAFRIRYLGTRSPRSALVAPLLAADDVLVDSMRGRSSTWTLIRLNLRHVPEDLRPKQETPDPDDDPTREWRELSRKKKE